MLVDFWTYTCINWLRTLAWVVPGRTGTPTRASSSSASTRPSSRSSGRRQRAPGGRGMDVRYPVAIDAATRCGMPSPTATGRPPTSPTRRADPAPPVRRGRVRRVGAGHPAAPTEAGRQRRRELVSVDARRLRGAGRLGEPRVARDVPRLQQAQNLVSAGERGRRLRGAASPGSSTSRRSTATGRRPGAVAGPREGRLSFRFHARDVHLVMGPASATRRCRSGCCSTASPRAGRTDSTSTS